MKMAIALLVLAASTQVFAAEKKVRASAHTCDELNAIQREAGSIYVMTVRDWGNSYQSSTVCKPGYDSVAAYVKSSDKLFCRIGFACNKRR